MRAETIYFWIAFEALYQLTLLRIGKTDALEIRRFFLETTY